MQHLALGQYDGGGDAARGRHRRGAQDRIGAEREGDEAGDHAGGRGTVGGVRFAPGEGQERRGEGDHGEAEEERTGEPTEECRHAAQKADQREGAHAGGARAFLAVALLPAALDTDQETDGKRQEQPLKNDKRVHEAQGRMNMKSASGSQFSATNCSSDLHIGHAAALQIFLDDAIEHIARRAFRIIAGRDGLLHRQGRNAVSRWKPRSWPCPFKSVHLPRARRTVIEAHQIQSPFAFDQSAALQQSIIYTA